MRCWYSAHAEEYQRLIKDFEVVGRDQAKAMARLTAAQQTIANNTAAITENLTAQLGWSRQRQALDGVLDIRAKRYLKDMQVRAKDMLRRSMYYVVMGIATSSWTTSLRSSSITTRSSRGCDPGGDHRVGAGPQAGGGCRAEEPARALAFTRTPSMAEKMKTLDEDVLNMGCGIVATDLRQPASRATASYKNSAKMALMAAEREQLAKVGCGAAQPGRTGVAGYDWEDGRIVDITIDALELDMLDPNATDESGSLRLTFEHSGINILRGRTAADQGGDPVFYFFRAADRDDPISWGTTYNYLSTTSTSKLTKDERVQTGMTSRGGGPARLAPRSSSWSISRPSSATSPCD